MEEGILKKNGIAILKGEIIAFIINSFSLLFHLNSEYLSKKYH